MSLPLVESFPGTEGLARIELCELPTPVEPLPYGAFAGVSVKRDDLTSPVYGGNKVRKLEFLLGDALEKDAKTVLTFGAYGSNHALATALYASRLGLEPHVVLSPQEPGPFAPRTLLAHAGIGSVIHLVEGWDGKRAAVEAMRELEERDGIEPYVIPMGGTNALGAVGYVNAALELFGQGVVPSSVYVAGGTLGTAIGLAIGFAAAGVDTHVQAVRVTPEEVAAPERAGKLTAETTSLLHSLDARFPLLTADDLRFTLRHDWFEPGYGIPTPETTDAVATAEGDGLHLETTYTGKAFAALLADLDSGAAGDGVLFWNTYNSAPYPAPGPIEVLPQVLRDYIAQCEEQFGKL